MKKINILFILAGIVLMGLISSCDNNDHKDLPLSLKLNNTTATDSVFSGESCTISGVAQALGKIDKIQIFKSFPWNNGTADVEIAGFGIYAGTAAYDQIADTVTNYSFNFTIQNIKTTTNLRIQLTDKNGKTVSVNYTIKIRQSNIESYLKFYLGGADSGYYSALDADTGTPHGSASLSDPAVVAVVDMFFDFGELANYDLDGTRFKDTGTRFAKTLFSSTDFDGFKSDDAFKAMSVTLNLVPIGAGDVVLFQTKSGKKGLLNVISMTSPTGDLLVSLKVQKE